jgi:tetratricopeptide (TPR) repeat protein
MTNSHKWSFRILVATVFLLPIFFIPGGALALQAGKAALLFVGVVLSLLLFLYESSRKGSVTLPHHYFLLAAALLPAVYFLSALLTTPSSLSLLGYNFEVGTTGSILMGSLLLLLAGALANSVSRTVHLLSAVFISLSVLAVFSAIKIVFGGDALSLGQFFTNMGNPLGAWTDLSVAFGALAILSLLGIGMLPMKGAVRGVAYFIFFLSTALLAVINFSNALVLALAASVLLSIYFLRVERDFLQDPVRPVRRMGLIGPIVLGVVSLIFLINPGNIGRAASGAFGVENTEVRPTLSATLSISKAVLSQTALLGSGPNTFGRDWLVYKPVDVNATPFWGVAFPFGAGFIPTQIATTGILGTFLWLAFFVLFLSLGVKAFNNIPESRASRFAVVSSFALAAFLWASMFFYTPSLPILMLAFVFSGLFAASLLDARVIGEKVFVLRGAEGWRFGAAAAVLTLALAALLLGFFGGKKTFAAYHFRKAVDLSNTAGTPLGDIEIELDKAASFDPVDAHYIAISRINFAKAQAAASSATGTPETNLAIFQDAIGKSIAAARSAVARNPASFGNWAFLGQVYSSLVPPPLNVEGAYENANFAYNEAYKRNPMNPELPLLLARLELNKGSVENARSYIRSSIALKDDYADAYLLLAQLEAAEKNLPAAIASAERLAALTPDNAGVRFELGLLKFSNNNFEDAAVSFSQALEILPEYANAKYYLGLALANLGREDEARKHLEELLITNPDSVELKQAIENLK